MAKQVIAVTNIKFNNQFTPAGQPLDVSAMKKADLVALYDVGAIRVEELPEPRKEVTSPVKPDATQTNSTEKSVANKEDADGKGNAD